MGLRLSTGISAGQAPGGQTRLSLGLAVVVSAGLTVGLAASPAAATPRADCANAAVFQSLDRLTTAVGLYDRARDAGAPCGSGKRAQAVRRQLDRASRLTTRGAAAEARGDDEKAIERYRKAGALNAEDEAADEGLARLSEDPFATAEALGALGRDDEAEAAALEAVQAGATPPPGSISEQLLTPSWAERARDRATGWLTSWWAEITLGLVLLAMLLAYVARRSPIRRLFRHPVLRWLPPKLRLAVEVEQASGAEPELTDGFAAQVRTRLRELSARYASDPRVVYGSDAPVDVPVQLLPAQAKVLTELWGWFRKTNTVTLKVTMLPADEDGVACHVVLLERDGSATRGVRVPERALRYRPTPWEFTPEPGASWCSLQWMPLANLATAWALFAFRSLQVPPATLVEEFGTACGRAYNEMLAGLEHGDTPVAMRHYRQAVLIDPDFVEAQLNLASALGNTTTALMTSPRDTGGALERVSESGVQDALGEAEGVLVTQVIKRLRDPGTPPEPGDKRQLREHALWLRASYSLAMVRLNRLAATLATEQAASGAAGGRRLPDRATPAQEAADLVASLATLHGLVAQPPEPDDPGDSDPEVALQRKLAAEHDQLSTLKRQLEAHVKLLLASAVDLRAMLPTDPADPGDPGDRETAGETPRPSPEPLPTDLDPAKVTCTCPHGESDGHRELLCRRTAVQLMEEVPMVGTRPRLHYTLACAWARDYRGREPRLARTETLRRCAERLEAALEDPRLARRWRYDPDLAPIVEQLEDASDALRESGPVQSALGPTTPVVPAQKPDVAPAH